MNVSLNQTTLSLAHKDVLEILELTFLIIICLLTLLGNFMVILAFLLGPRSIRNYTNYFVVNLAVSDLMVGCLSLPFWIVYRIDNDLVSRSTYTYFISVDILCGTASILSLVAISLERMFAVKFPTTHFNLNAMPIYIGIAATWALGVVLTASKFGVTTRAENRIYTASIFTFAFLLPLFIIVASYILIFQAAVKMMSEIANHPGKIAREIHVAKTISVIIALFMLCWMPFFVINMVWVFCSYYCEQKSNYKWVVYVSKMMHYSNSMMNFFVYAVRLPDFRRAFEAILFKCDTSTLRERVRTFSESIVTRGRTASERISFIQDSRSPINGSVNNNNESDKNSQNSIQHSRCFKTHLSRHLRLSEHSHCTEISIMEETWIPSTNASNTSSNTTTSSNNPLLGSSSSNGGKYFENFDVTVSSI